MRNTRARAIRRLFKADTQYRYRRTKRWVASAGDRRAVLAALPKLLAALEHQEQRRRNRDGFPWRVPVAIRRRLRFSGTARRPRPLTR